MVIITSRALEEGRAFRYFPAVEKLVQAMGASSSLGLSIRYALTEMGRNAAKEAFDQNLYLGPAPVSLPAYTEQLEVQRIANELLDSETLRRGFEGLVVPENYLRKLLPAVRSGRIIGTAAAVRFRSRWSSSPPRIPGLSSCLPTRPRRLSHRSPL